MNNIYMSASRSQWLDLMSDEDRAFIKRFLQASGSLKELAGIYGVSYPTIRLRLDRLIAKVAVADEHEQATPFERKLRARYAEGRLDGDTFRELLAAHHAEVEKDHAKSKHT